MISMMSNDCELDRKSDFAADLYLYRPEHPDVIRVSGATPGGEMEAEDEVRYPDGEEVRDLDSNCGDVGSVAEHVEAENVGCVQVIDSRVSVVQTEDDLPLNRESPGFSVQDTRMKRRDDSDFDSLYSKVDENSVPELPPEALDDAETAMVLRYGFNIGDMVWGKVKSHPLWPGHIFNEAFASPSVRRTKREGHILVAFFGDSSYGWFDPAELIPFEPNYAEKSRQSNSRNFLKAVEEAVDEASRRCALGLSCRCRSPFNFRPTNVQGYFSVDVDGYEPGGVYSVKQIKMARDSFRPGEMLSFVLQMALTPRSSEKKKGIDWIKDKATIMAYRKAVFEEYDETYAQAFGVQTVRPTRDSMGVLVQPEKFSIRAPLSGPLVFAEALGERKSSTKPMKGKDKSKKDKYLLKRREGLNDPKAHHISQGHVGISEPSSYKDGVAALAGGDYLLQKRESMKPRTPGKVGAGMISAVVSVLRQGGAGQEVTQVDKKPGVANFSSVDLPVNTNRDSELVGFQLLSSPVAISGAPAAQEGKEYGKQPLDKEMCVLQEVKGRVNVDVVGGPVSDGMHGSDAVGMLENFSAVHQAFRPEDEAMVNGKHEEHLKVGSTVEGLEPPRMSITKPSEDHHRLDQVQEGGSGIPCSLSDVKHPAGKVINMGRDAGMKAKKVPKRPREELNSEKSDTVERKKKKEPGSSLDHQQKHLKTVKVGESMGERKKKKKKKEPVLEASLDHQQKHLKTVKDGESMGERKKKKKEPGLEASLDHQQKPLKTVKDGESMGERKKKNEPGLEASLDQQHEHLKTVKDGESMRKSAGKSIGIGMDPQRKVDVANSIVPSSSLTTQSVVDMGNVNVDFPQLVDDLLSLALDPFYGIERNSPAIVRQVFLQFRSLVYQKSLILLPSTEAEAEPSDRGNNPAITDAVEVPTADDGNQPSASRSSKQLFRPEDTTKAVRKRSPSDRQEEISSKRMKRMKELMLMTAEKKAGNLKTSEMQRDRKDVKDTGVVVSAKPIKPDSVKKLEAPLKDAEPTMLVMKFPPKTTLPSVPQLKARFVRFGPLDHSAIRVLWNSSTCRVVFKHKSHAHAAYDYAVRNNSLFGSTVKYHLRDLHVRAQDPSDSVKRKEDAADETTQLRVPSTTNSAGEPRKAAFLPRQPQPAVQLKSCLKRPTADEAGPNVGVPWESPRPRVKFMLGGDESSRGEQLVVRSSVNNNGSNADGDASSLAMDVNTKNFQKDVSPLPPLPPRSIPDVHESRAVGQLAKYHHVRPSQVETRNNPNNVGNTATTTAPTYIDISHQMLSLLMRCSDIVTDVRSSLGHGPYHRL